MAAGGSPERTGGLLDRADVRALERLSLDALEALVAGLVGEREAPGRSSGFEFADYRRYTPGDDVRRIDWNVYERLRELHVRTAPQEARVGLAVLLDASRSMDSGEHRKLRYATRLAALLGAVAMLREDTVELDVLSDGESSLAASFDSGASQLGALVEALERVRPGGGTRLARSVRRARASGWEAEIAVLISDGLVARADMDEAIEGLARSARTAALVHVIERDGDIASLTDSTLLVDSETGRRLDATITDDVLQRYAARYEGWRREIEQRCRAHGVSYVSAPTTLDPFELLLAAARGRGLVRLAGRA